MKNNYEIVSEDTVVIFVYNRGEYHECLVDIESFNRMLELDVKWTGLAEGNSVYAIANVIQEEKRTTLRLHRWLTNAEPGTVVDHVNHNGLDNRLSNLNVVGKSENAQNLSKLKSNNTSGYRGVTWHKDRRKWVVQVNAGGKHIHGGVFDNIEDAATASENLMKEYLPYYNQINRPKVVRKDDGV